MSHDLLTNIHSIMLKKIKKDLSYVRIANTPVYLGGPELREFEPGKVGEQKYPITQHQPIYFVTDSFEDAKQKMM